MAFDQCKNCGKEIKTSVTNCPHCGANDPTRERFLKAAAGIIIVIMLFIAFSGGGDGQKENNSSSKAVTETTQKDDEKVDEKEKKDKQVQEQRRIIKETMGKFREADFLKRVDEIDRTYYVNNLMWRMIDAQQKENSVTWFARHAGYFFSEVNEPVGITVKDSQSGKTIAEYGVFSGVSIE